MWEIIAKVATVEAAAFIGLFCGFALENNSRRRKRKRRLKESGKRKEMDFRRRVEQERKIMSILNETVTTRKSEPIRKVCGIFGTPEAQEILK